MPEIRTIAVIGAGSSGRSPAGRNIAHATALAGYPTILEDILPASLRHAEAEIRLALTQTSAGQESADAILARISYAATVEEAARPADLVIECVPDELESKLEIFTLLDKICRPHTILASTTYLLNISEMAAVTYRPQQCLCLRFSRQTDDTTLELVRGEQTNDETVAACVAVAQRIGKVKLSTQPRGLNAD